MRQPYSSKLEIPVPVSVLFTVEGEREPVRGWIARLSLAGVDIETMHAPPMGTLLVFRAALDPESPEVLEFTGRVRWVSGTRVGIQFAELGAKETHSIVEAMRVATAAGDGPISPPVSAVASVQRAPKESEIEIPITFDDEERARA
jgi:hypothetical protein